MILLIATDHRSYKQEGNKTFHEHMVFKYCLRFYPMPGYAACSRLPTFNLHLKLFYFLKDPAPPDPVVSVTKPDQRSLSYDMIFRNIAPVAAVKRIVTVISHHPIIIHLESISRRGFIINEILTVFFFQFIAFIGIYRPAIAGFVRKYERALVIFSQRLRYNIFYSRKHF